MEPASARQSPPRATRASGLRLVQAPIQPIIPGTEAVKANRPFVARCRMVRTGNAVRKAIYLVLASYCAVYVDGEDGRCFPSRDRIREEAEVGVSRFWREWRAMVTAGLISVVKQGPFKPCVVTVHSLRPAPVRRPPKHDPRPTSNDLMDAGESKKQGQGSTVRSVPDRRRASAQAAAVRDERRRQQQLDRDERRYEGLIATVAARSRDLDVDFDEDRTRADYEAGRINLGTLQKRADELRRRERAW